MLTQPSGVFRTHPTMCRVVAVDCVKRLYDGLGGYGRGEWEGVCKVPKVYALDFTTEEEGYLLDGGLVQKWKQGRGVGRYSFGHFLLFDGVGIFGRRVCG